MTTTESPFQRILKSAGQATVMEHALRLDGDSDDDPPQLRYLEDKDTDSAEHMYCRNGLDIRLLAPGVYRLTTTTIYNGRIVVSVRCTVSETGQQITKAPDGDMAIYNTLGLGFHLFHDDDYLNELYTEVLEDIATAAYPLAYWDRVK